MFTMETRKKIEVCFEKVEIKEELEESDDLKDSVHQQINYLSDVKVESQDINGYSCDVKTEPTTINCLLYCCDCQQEYEDFCLRCTMISHVLDSEIPKGTERRTEKTVPKNVLEIKRSSVYDRMGVFASKTIPNRVRFGPFEGPEAVESTTGHTWRMDGERLKNVDDPNDANWMVHVNCAGSAEEKNLVVFQHDGRLYYRSDRQIDRGEELLVYFGDDFAKSGNYYQPSREKIDAVFSCVPCGLGFNSEEHLERHRTKCTRYRMEVDDDTSTCSVCKSSVGDEHLTIDGKECPEKRKRRGAATTARRRNPDPLDPNGDDESGDYPRYLEGGDPRADGVTRELYTYEYDGSYVCLLCDGRFPTKRLIRAHLKAEHGDVKRHKCSRCDYQTNRTGDFNKHFVVHRDAKPYGCEVCGRKFKRTANLRQHVRDNHCGGEGERHNCPKCPFVTKYKSCLKRHVFVHDDVKPFQCPACPKQFTTGKSRDLHVKVEHVASDRKEYGCTRCAYQTNYKSHLRRHAYTHEEVKPLQCGACLKQFITNDNFKNHMKGHAEEAAAAGAGHAKVEHLAGTAKDFKCPKCPYETNHKSHLRRHVYTHDNVKPLQCELCFKRFITKDNLRNHVNNVHGDGSAKARDKTEYLAGTAKEYRCPKCPSYETDYKSHLRRHLHTHEEVKPFQCSMCLKQFIRGDNLRTHVRSVHDIVVDVKKEEECS